MFTRLFPSQDDGERSRWAFGGAALLLCFATALLLGRASRPTAPNLAVSPAGPSILYFVDPMHPSYRSDHPGVAPDCGMDLVAVYASGSKDASNPLEPAGTVILSREQQEHIGLRTSVVDPSKSDAANLQVPGRVLLYEPGVTLIQSAVAGVMKAVGAATVGSRVGKGQLLGRFYSPEFIPLEQSFLVASERMAAGPSEQTRLIREKAAAQLVRAGMDEQQIARIAETRSLPDTVEVLSPTQGTLLSQTVVPGQSFERGTELYRLGDLTRVKVRVELPVGEEASFRPQAEVTFHVAGETQARRARVTDSVAQYDATTHVAEITLLADNPALRLQPDMLVLVDLPSGHHQGVRIAADAVATEGAAQRVYIDQGSGHFSPRSVTTGRRAGNQVEVLQGLQAGERVVVAGTFLLDAESRLRPASQE